MSDVDAVHALISNYFIEGDDEETVKIVSGFNLGSHSKWNFVQIFLGPSGISVVPISFVQSYAPWVSC